MHEISYFRTPFGSQRVNGSKTLLKCAGQKFYSSFALISEISTTKTFLLFRSQIWRMCFCRLTGDHMYSHLHREIFPQLVRTPLSQKPETFSRIYIPFFKSTWNFENLWKKRGPSSLKYFWSFWHRRMWFLECSKAPASEHPFEVNELTGQKHCWHVKVGGFILVLH